MSRQHRFSRIRVLFAAALVAGTLAGVGMSAARPQAARADTTNVGTVLCQIITLSLGCSTPFGTNRPPAPPVCDVRDLAVEIHGPRELHYQYVLACDVELLRAMRVVGIYNGDTGQAEEQMTQLQPGGRSGVARWTCPVDPWRLASGSPDCTPVGQGPVAGTITMLGIEMPFSVYFLDAADRRQLHDATPVVVGQPGGTNRLSDKPVQYTPDLAAWPTLGEGTQGESAKTIQYLLRHHGATLDVDGDYGPVTAEAVRAFQRQKGLVVDGVVGPQTWEALMVSPLGPSSRGEAVRAVQSQLASRGVAIPVTGTYGPETMAAVKAYQQPRALASHGLVARNTWQSLVTGR